MTTPSLGSFNFVAARGEIRPPGPVVEAIQRQGINGTAWRYLGSFGQPFRLQTEAFFSAATGAGSVTAAINAYRAAVGSRITYTDALGATWTVIVEDVHTRQARRVLGSSLGSGYLLQALWILRMPGAY